MSDHTLSPFAARFYGVAVIVAPLLMLASTLAFITAGDGINQGVLGNTMGVWVAFTFATAMVGILRLLEPRAPRAAPILTAFTLAGFCGGVAINMDYLMAELGGPEFDAAINEAIDAQPIAILALLPWGWFAPLSLILVGIFLWRTRTTAWWNGALLIAGGVLFVASRPESIEVLALVADGVLILALVPIGLSMLARGRSATSPERTVAQPT